MICVRQWNEKCTEAGAGHGPQEKKRNIHTECTKHSEKRWMFKSKANTLTHQQFHSNRDGGSGGDGEDDDDWRQKTNKNQIKCCAPHSSEEQILYTCCVERRAHVNTRESRRSQRWKLMFVYGGRFSFICRSKNRFHSTEHHCEMFKWNKVCHNCILLGGQC